MQTAETPRRKPMELTESFRPLPVHFFEVWEHNGWRLKVYGISRHHQRPGAELIKTAKRAAAQRLPGACDDEGAHGVGFISVHEARDANFVFVNWWARESELRRHVFRSPLESPDALEEVSGISGTVCDLQVLWFERNAWVEKVLGNARGPDVEAYLKKRLSDQA